MNIAGIQQSVGTKNVMPSRKIIGTKTANTANIDISQTLISKEEIQTFLLIVNSKAVPRNMVDNLSGSLVNTSV